MMATLRVNPVKTSQIASFMNSYLKLNHSELVVHTQDMQNIAPEEKEFVLVIENEWTEMGEAKDLERVVLRAFSKGVLSP